MASRFSKKVQFSFEVDKDLKINSWSDDLEIIYGKSFAEVQDIYYYKVIPRINQNGKDAVKQVLKSGKTLILKGSRTTCFCGDSNTSIRITPLKNELGKVNGANIAISASPSCAIWRKLKQSQRLMDIGKIAATFAHGIRNPLNAIKGAVVYLREKYEGERKLLEFTKIIEEEISRLDSFIAKFLSTSFSEKGLSETDINSVLKKVEVLISLQAQSRRIESVFEYGYPPSVAINSFHLGHAILNIINNAIEAMPSGGRLMVKTQSENRSGTEFALVEVSDSGPGMIVDRNGEVVKPSKIKGKGLGLFITREILRSCGGHLEIKSKKGVGTVVKLYVPVNKNG
ncbi:MAG: histidine kinase [Nitrospirae bacterium]|nr:histidine kinase [Nitrospirota bacterium]